MGGSTKNKANSAFSQVELGLSLAINKFSSDMHYKISNIVLALSSFATLYKTFYAKEDNPFHKQNVI